MQQPSGQPTQLAERSTISSFQRNMFLASSECFSLVVWKLGLMFLLLLLVAGCMLLQGG
jgi:hypothetical protein